jgi:hypothetical protein
MSSGSIPGSAEPGSIILGSDPSPTSTGPTGLAGTVSGITPEGASEDFSIIAGDTSPRFVQQLSWSDGSAVDLTGASAGLVLRNLTSASPLTLTGAVSIQTPESYGIVQWDPSALDTAIPGEYMGRWVVNFGEGQQQSFPTDGYLSVSVEPNLSSAETQQLVSLPDVREHLNIPTTDRVSDAKLLRWINTATTLIEQRTGPILLRTYDEKYSGGNNVISLTHRPSVGYGSSPVLNVMAVSEYVGPTEYPLSNVNTAALGSIYSFEVNVRLGTITRRTAGGGTIAFPIGENSVHVVYQSGQQTIPEIIQEAAMECVRIYYQTTMAVGRGSRSRADESDTGPQLAYVMPPSALRLLNPMRRGPSIA